MREVHVRLKGAENGLHVRLIYTWTRAAVMAVGQIMSSSSGPKNYLRNDIYSIFERDPAIDAAYLVRASGPAFLLIRKGKLYFDATSAEVEVTPQKKTTAAAPATAA